MKYTSIFPKVKFSITSHLQFQWKICLPAGVHGDSDTSGFSSEVLLEVFSCWSQWKYSSLKIQQRQQDST